MRKIFTLFAALMMVLSMSAATWTVAGEPAAVFHNHNWSNNAAANDMVQQADGTFKWERTDLTLAENTKIQFKVCKDHGWTTAYPSSNYELTIQKSGIYTITITFNPSGNKVEATATLQEEQEVIATVAVKGAWDNWANTTALTLAEDKKTAATTIAVAKAGDFKFGLEVNGGFVANGGTVSRTTNSVANLSGNTGDMTLKADMAGDYTFTWEYATKTLTVTYPALPVKYNVTVTVENGTVTGAGEYEEGKTATLTATPAEGYQFVNWTKGGEVVSAENPYAFVVTENVELVANFKAVEATVYTISIEAVNGTVTGAGEYEEGKEATLTATANEGYEFTCWTSGEDTVSTENPYTFAVTADLALVANFNKKAEPTTETIYFIDVKKWGKVNAYAWNTNGDNGWPGAAATKEAEQIAGFDVYSFTANAGQYANVIFNNKVGDTGSQTEDLVWTAGKYYWMGVAKNFAGATKEEAEATLAAPLPDVWNIVGDAGLMGKGWDLNAAENAMTKQEDGTYKLEKKDITLTAGTYEYKAAKDHSWDVSVPSGQTNQKLTISKSGIYDVTFVLDVTAKKLTATATLKKEAVVIPTVIIAGDMNSWNQTKDKFTMSADSLTATFKATLAVKNYAFKMIVGGAWHSDGKTITRAANSTKFTGANSNTNSTLKADIAGEYLFTWEYATKTLTVTYPALPVKYNVTVTAEHGTVTGAGTYEKGKTATLTATPAEGYEFVNWTKDEEVVSTENPYTFVVTADVALVANFKAVEPETITWELNGGEFPAVVVPTNAELWGTDTADVNGFMHYYNHYYNLKRATQTIENVASFAYAQMQQIMTDEASEYKWLGDYIQTVATAAGKPLSTDMAAPNESGWRWSVWAFFNACEGKNGSAGIDFTEAGKPEVWGAAYEAEYGVVLPTEPVAEDYVLPTPVKEGYKFVGWYDNAEGAGDAYTVIPAGWAGTLYAIWEVEGPATALENIAVEGKAVKAIINGQLIIIKNGVQYNAQGAILK